MEAKLIVPSIQLGLGTNSPKHKDGIADNRNVTGAQIMDFNDIAQVACSRVQDNSHVFNSKPMPTATVEEEVIMESILTEPNRKKSGASESLKSTSLSVEHKSYCIFVAPKEL